MKLNGRDSNGRFTKGNAGGAGNPHAAKVAKLRAALLGAVSTTDVELIIASMVEAAKDGDVVAAREVLDRTIGKAVAMDLLQRIESLEEIMGANKQ